MNVNFYVAANPFSGVRNSEPFFLYCDNYWRVGVGDATKASALVKVINTLRVK
jgi:hypothetical protein